MRCAAKVWSQSLNLDMLVLLLLMQESHAMAKILPNVPTMAVLLRSVNHATWRTIVGIMAMAISAATAS
jgi:hypothetical protein